MCFAATFSVIHEIIANQSTASSPLFMYSITTTLALENTYKIPPTSYAFETELPQTQGYATD
jgi:hypothetical protein